MASFTRVSVDEMKFTPAHVEIVRGTSVRWEQSPKCMVRHCLEVVDPEENNQASSPALLPGEPWEHTFEACGDFHYRSLVYCFMKGTIKVVDGASAETRAPGGAKGTDAPVETAAVPVDAGDAPSSAAKAFRSRASSPRETEDARSANSVVEREPVAARFDDADANSGFSSSGRSIDPDPASCIGSIGSDDEPRPVPGTSERKTSPTTSSSPTASDPPSEVFFKSCDRCARAFVSSTNLQRHRASHGSRGSGKNKGKNKNKIGSSRLPKPPPASAEEVAAFFEGLSDDKKREALRSVAEPGSAGALVVCGVRARRASHENRTRSHAASHESRRAAYISAGAAVARMVDAFDAKDGGDAGMKKSTSFSTLFDALVGASEGTCFGPRAELDLTTMCLDENLDAALAYCVEQRLFALYLEERSAEAEAARKLLLAEIDESRAEEERRAARRAEARARKKTNEANDRSARAKSLREKEAEEETELNASETGRREEAVTTEAIADGAPRRTETAKNEIEKHETPESAEKVAREDVPSRTTGCQKSRGPDFRGDSAKGGGATPTPPSSSPAPRTRAVDKRRDSILTARPTTAPPSPLPPPNPPSAAEGTPRAVPAPRRTGIQSRTSPATSAAASGAARDAVVKPLREPVPLRDSASDGVSKDVSVLEPSAAILARVPGLAGDFKNTTHKTPRKSRRALKAERAEARAMGVHNSNGGSLFGSATDFESASGSDFERKTASDTEFGVLRRGGVLQRDSVALTSSLDAEGTETSTRRARAAARAPEKAPRADVRDSTSVVVADRRTVAESPSSAVPTATRPLVEDSFASPTGTPAKFAVRDLAATPVAMFASPPSAARAIPVAPVWSPERDTARMATHAPPAFAPSMFPAVGAAGPIAPGGVMPLGHFPSVLHPMHHPPPGVDMEVYMHHYATALAAIQASQAVAARPGPAPFAPPLPPGPPPRSSRVREDF